MIKIEHVTKYFEDYPVLNDLSLTVPKVPSTDSGTQRRGQNDPAAASVRFSQTEQRQHHHRRTGYH